MPRKRRAPLTVRRAAERIARFRERMFAAPDVTHVQLDAVRARLELYLHATYASAIALDALPPKLDRAPDGTDAVTQYRLLAVEHAERMMRGGDARVPAQLSQLEQDLFLIAESSAVDASIAQSQPGLVPLLRAARATALATRIPSRTGSLEAEVEGVVKHALAEFPSDVRTVNDSLAWARAEAAAMLAAHPTAARYRGVPPIAFWKTYLTAPLTGKFRIPPPLEPRLTKKTKTVATDPSQPSEQSPQAGDGTAPPPENAPPTRDAFALSERDPKAVRRTKKPEGVPHHYREWDDLAGAYHPDGATVYVTDAPAESPAWAEGVEREHAVLLRQVRQRFERLQSHRLHLKRQLNGDELDLDACVAAHVDRRAGRTPDDRLYTAVRPGRRAIAISLIVDASASTKLVVHDTLRIIDVERLAVLVAAEAFDALGDGYDMLAFSSDGASDVRVRTLKHFHESRSALRSRVSGLAPRGETRMGAAIRHATAQLLRRSAPHRLLLMVSDGKPNDSDRYFLDYGVADSRRAVLDARAAGVHPYCITVDAEEPGAYLADIFGRTGYLVVRRPEQLPQALVRSVQMLIPG